MVDRIRLWSATRFFALQRISRRGREFQPARASAGARPRPTPAPRVGMGRRGRRPDEVRDHQGAARSESGGQVPEQITLARAVEVMDGERADEALPAPGSSARSGPRRSNGRRRERRSPWAARAARACSSMAGERSMASHPGAWKALQAGHARAAPLRSRGPPAGPRPGSGIMSRTAATCSSRSGHEEAAEIDEVVAVVLVPAGGALIPWELSPRSFPYADITPEVSTWRFSIQ